MRGKAKNFLKFPCSVPHKPSYPAEAFHLPVEAKGMAVC